MLTWEEIKEQFDGEWVELVDCDWPEGEPYPRSAVVRVHASDKKEFYTALNRRVPKPTDSSLLFIGKPAQRQGALFGVPFAFRAS